MILLPHRIEGVEVLGLERDRRTSKRFAYSSKHWLKLSM